MKAKLYLLAIILIFSSFTSCDKSEDKNPIVTIEMSDGDIIKIELYPKKAPNTVSNFVSLINEGFYDGLIFHRVIPNFMIQGGDPEGTGQGGPGYSIKGEFSNNSFTNNLKHTEGVISMARSQDYNSAGSQFFIMVADRSDLDNDYATFGKVIEGYSNCEKISKTETDSTDKPIEPQTIKKMTVENDKGISKLKKIKN